MAKTDKNKKKKASKTAARDDKKSRSPAKQASAMTKTSPKPVKGKATKTGNKEKEKSKPVPVAAKAASPKAAPAKKTAAPDKPTRSVSPVKAKTPAKKAAPSAPPRNNSGKGPVAKTTTVKATAAKPDSTRKPSTTPSRAAVATKSTKPTAPAVQAASDAPKKNAPLPAKPVKTLEKASTKPEAKAAPAAISTVPAARDTRKTPAAAVKPAPAKDVRKPQPQKPDSKKATTGVKLLKPVNLVNPLEPPANPDALIHGQKPYIAQPGEEYMSDGQIEHFRRILLAWKQELMEEVDRTVHHMQDESANLPDPNDRATQEEEFALELRTRDRERKLIKKIEKTLGLLDSREYGYCEACGIEIGIRRLEARPTADLCFDCKTLAEIKERQVGSLA